jgi:oligopeptidase B
MSLDAPPHTDASRRDPPRAARRHRTIEAPAGSRDDPYYWLRDDERTNEEVLAHLRAENAYTDAVLSPIQPLIESLYGEMVGRLKQDDASVPIRHRGYWYQLHYEPRREYPIYTRRLDVAGEPQGEVEVLLDCNELAAGHPFFQLGGYEVSPDNRLLAYAVDTVGRRQYQIHVRDLTKGELYPEVIYNAEPGVAWTDDNRLLYVEKDPVTLLGRRVRVHQLGNKTSTDVLLYEEPDESFDLVVERSKSERFLYIGAESTTSSEWRYTSASGTALDFKVFLPRQREHEYEIEHLPCRMHKCGAGQEPEWGGRRSEGAAERMDAQEQLEQSFLVRTNWQAENFRIMSVPIGTERDQAQWQDVIAHDASVFIHDFEIFDGFLAVSERSRGLRNIRIRPWRGETYHIAADDPAYTMHLGANPEMDTHVLRYSYTSLTTPTTVYAHDTKTRKDILLKREPVLGEFDSNRYASEFIWVTARDGEQVPVSVVYRKNVAIDGQAPLFQYGYGSYGICIDPSFSSARLSLLDRGFVYAIAHVRGGQELGRRWYNAGRLLNKWNTFHDFIDVTDYLVAQGYGHKHKVFASGGSAGGLLMGAIMNMAPEKYAGIVANVPFVDVVTTMLDDSIPLTTLEYDEWGNPNEQRFYEYMLSYSPYDNLKRQAYPPLLVTTGYWDSQVQYFEPAKWVAKLREFKTDDKIALLHTNLEAGHGGKSGRYEHLREIAREYAFVIALNDGRLSAT